MKNLKKPFKIYLPKARKHRTCKSQKQAKNSKQQVTKQEQKPKIVSPIILFIQFRIIFIEHARLFIDTKCLVGAFRNIKIIPNRDF